MGSPSKSFHHLHICTRGWAGKATVTEGNTTTSGNTRTSAEEGTYGTVKGEGPWEPVAVVTESHTSTVHGTRGHLSTRSR